MLTSVIDIVFRVLVLMVPLFAQIIILELTIFAFFLIKGFASYFRRDLVLLQIIDRWRWRELKEDKVERMRAVRTEWRRCMPFEEFLRRMKRSTGVSTSSCATLTERSLETGQSLTFTVLHLLLFPFSFIASVDCGCHIQRPHGNSSYCVACYELSPGTFVLLIKDDLTVMSRALIFPGNWKVFQYWSHAYVQLHCLPKCCCYVAAKWTK